MLPVVMEIQSLSRQSGDWVRRVSFTEFPDCVAESESMEDSINEAYRQLVEQVQRSGSSSQPATRRPLRADLGPLIELYRSPEY